MVPDIAVVVPTYGRAERLAPLLAALSAQVPGPDAEILIVDDCSPDDTRQHLAALAAASPLDVRVLTTPANGGPAVARNVGWRASGASVVAFLDDDCLPAPGWLAAGVASLAGSPQSGVVQGRTSVPTGSSTDRLEDWWLWRTVEGAGPHFEGCNIFYRRSALEAAGGFDEGIGWWGEDTALGWTVADAGWSRGYAPDAHVVHPIERRGWWWFVANGVREANLVTLATRHPGFRREAFWRPWAYRRRDVAFVVAVACSVVAASGRHRRPAAVLALPYVWWARPSVRRRSFPRLCFQIPAVDAARVAGHLVGSLRERTLVI